MLLTKFSIPNGNDKVGSLFAERSFTHPSPPTRRYIHQDLRPLAGHCSGVVSAENRSVDNQHPRQTLKACMAPKWIFFYYSKTDLCSHLVQFSLIPFYTRKCATTLNIVSTRTNYLKTQNSLQLLQPYVARSSGYPLCWKIRN